MRILLVEDEAKLAADLAVALEHSGHGVDQVRDGEKAWFLGDTEDFAAAVRRPRKEIAGRERRALTGPPGSPP